MKKNALSARKWLMVALTLTGVLAVFLFGGDFAKKLQTNVPGYSIPIDTNYSSFGCKSGGSWADTVWCQAYGSTYDAHVTEANKHTSTVVMFKRTAASGGFGVPNIGDYYVVGNYGSSALGKNGQTYNAGSYVKCPAGASVQYHSKSHHKYSPSLGEGFYDGDGHYWCESNGVAVDPEKLDGRLAGLQLPDSDVISMDKLYPIYFPGGIVKYKKIDDTSSYYKCTNGYEGAYEPGVNQYLNMYNVPASWKKNYYRCLTADGSGFEKAVTDGSSALMTTSSGQVNISSSLNNLSDAINCSADYTSCQASCAAGDSSCGGAGTYVTGATKCASNTYIFQTEESLTRYCAASPTSGTHTPPPPTWTISAPTNLRITGSKTTGFALTDSVPVAADFAATGTGIPYGSAILTVQIAQDTSFSTAWVRPASTGYVSAIGSSVSSSISNFPASGTFYWRAKMSLGTKESAWSSAPYGSFAVCASGKSWNGTSCVTPTVATCSLGLTLNDNKTTYNKGDMVNYTYSCTPAGTRAANTYVQVVKPDGTATQYNSGTNIDTASMGFSTSNLSAGSYTLRVCLDAACTSGVASVSFAVAGDATTTPTGGTGVIPADWKEIIWNTLGLKSYVSINAPQSVIDAAKEACKNTRPENVSWPNPSDFTKPATAGIPSCNGTNVTPTGVTPTGVTPTGVTPTPAKQCAVGEKCVSGSWCNTGTQCYYPDSSLTCTEWNQGCPTGTKVCSPNDPKCIEPGTSGSIDGWCKNSMECYSKDKTKKFCQAWSSATAMAPAAVSQMFCPAEYPKSCGPNDPNCVEIGESGSANGWCSSGGKQCFKGDGSLYCAKMDESCPADSKVCRAGDTNCIEPGKYGPSNGWCGGSSSVQCHKKDGSGVYCGQVSGLNMDPAAWESFSCPADTGRCRPEDKFCLDKIGAKGPSGSWCAVGMSQYNSDGSITCVSGKDYKPGLPGTPGLIPPPMPPIEVCVPMQVVGYDPATLGCKNFASSCNVPMDWQVVTDGRVCKDGNLVNVDVFFDDTEALINYAKGRYDYLVTVVHQARQIPEYVPGIKAFREKLDGARVTLKKILNYKDKAKIKEDFQAFVKSVMPEIEQQWGELSSYAESAALENEIRREIDEYRTELSLRDPVDSSSDAYYKKLKEGIDKLENLLNSLGSQSDQAREALLNAIKQVRIEVQELVTEHRTGKSKESLEGEISDLVRAAEEFNQFIKDKDITDSKIHFAVERLAKIIASINEAGLDDAAQRANLFDEGMWLKNRIASWLAEYGYKIYVSHDINKYFDHLESKLTEKIEQMLGNIKGKMQLIIDDATQKLTVKMAEVVESFSNKFSAEFKEKYEKQSAVILANLAVLEEETRTEIAESKNKILTKLEDLDSAIEAAKLASFTTQALRNSMETVAGTTWCGENAESVQSKINNIGLALENNDISTEEIDAFKAEVDTFKASNSEECYRVGAIAFKDSPIDEWHNQYTQYNYDSGLMTGYTDANGQRTGYIGVANPTLRIEALAMVMRLLNIAEGDSFDLGQAVPGVPQWGIGYVNGAVDAGIKVDWTQPMDQPITRLEVAKLFVAAIQSLEGQTFFTPATTVEVADDKYGDWAQISKDAEGALAVEALTDFGIFQGGGDGNFHPYDSFLRSEFATTNKRLVETFGLEN